MPFIVQDLIAENPTVVVTTPDELVRDVLKRMIEHDFSQLPAVDKKNRPLGMVTSESLLRDLTGFGVNLDQLRVEHAIVRTDTYRGDADLFELLNRLRDIYAVLIVDGDGRLIGIVTNYDTSEFFRRRAEDIMLVEDIETMLKDYIQVAFTNESGEVNEDDLEEAVHRITDTGKVMREKFEKALIHYLTLQKGDGSSAQPKNEWLEQVYEQHYGGTKPGKTFDDLTLYEFIELLLDRSRWANYKSVFHLERNAIRNLLDRVRLTRNALAHFRGEITASERDHLRFSSNWLAQYQDAMATLPLKVEESTVSTVITEPRSDYEAHDQKSVKVTDSEFVMPIEDEPAPGESRYAALAIWLQSQPQDKKLVKPTLAKIEEIIGGNLPESAFRHRAWWANDTVGHVQSKQWLDVGWRVASVNMDTQVVRFARIQERQRAYIDFYSKLIGEMKKQPGYDYLRVLPDGVSWYWIKAVSVRDKALGSFNFAFGRSSIFRVELYVDSGEKLINKQLFDGLESRREMIEHELDRELTWQRLDNRRASRITVIFPGHITDSEEQLEQLRRRAVLMMVKFQETMMPRIEAIGREIL